MIKLYTKPGACSTADHIALEWSGLPYEARNMTQSQLKEPDFLKLNPAGSVPVLVDGDFVLTQNAAILGYIADSAPQSGLNGDNSPRARAEALRWIAYANSDLHPAFKPLFAPQVFLEDAGQADALRERARHRVAGLFRIADERLAKAEWLAGFRSGADAYLYVTLRWAASLGIDLSGLEHLAGYKRRLDADAAVRTVLEAEHLKPL